MSSKRKQVLDAVIVALEKISKGDTYNTDVKYVSPNLNISHPDELDKNKFPALFPADETEEKEQLSVFGDDDDDDMLSTLTITVVGMVFDRKGKTAEARCSLIQDVEKAIVNDTGLLTLLLEKPSPGTIETDKGFFSNYSIWSQGFEVQYVYNHESGG